MMYIENIFGEKWRVRTEQLEKIGYSRKLTPKIEKSYSNSKKKRNKKIFCINYTKNYDKIIPF